MEKDYQRKVTFPQHQTVGTPQHYNVMNKKFIIYWIPVIIYAGLIFYLSSLPNPLYKVEQIISIKLPDTTLIVLHIIEYLILSLLLYRALNNTKINNALTLTILITITYGFTDEIHQIFVPGRLFDFFDLLANSFGAIVPQSLINLKKLLN